MVRRLRWPGLVGDFMYGLRVRCIPLNYDVEGLGRGLGVVSGLVRVMWIAGLGAVFSVGLTLSFNRVGSTMFVGVVLWRGIGLGCIGRA